MLVAKCLKCGKIYAANVLKATRLCPSCGGGLDIQSVQGEIPIAELIPSEFMLDFTIHFDVKQFIIILVTFFTGGVLSTFIKKLIKR